MVAELVSFGPLVVDKTARVALRDGEPLPVGQRGALILGALMSRPGEILTKSELIDAAWGGAAIEESNLSVQVAALRRCLGQTPDGRNWIATIPRVGYRLAVAAVPGAAPAANSQPALLVMPFQALTEVPSGMAHGLADQVIVALASVPDLLVLTRRGMADDGNADDPCAIGADLGASHVLVGNLRCDDERVRVSARVLETSSGGAAWAESYLRDLGDPFAVEEEVARLIAAAARQVVTPNGPPADSARVPNNPEAAGHYVRGLAMLFGQTQNAAVFRRMVDKFERAAELEPGFASATAALAEAHFVDSANGWSGDRQAALAKARELADRAMAIDPLDPYGPSVSCLVALGERDLKRAEEDAAAALRLNPNDPMALAVQGNVRIAQDKPLEAIACLERSLSIASASHQYPLHHLALAYLAAGRTETAVALLRERILLVPGTDMSRGYLAGALCLLGEFGEARKVWAELMDINPRWSLVVRSREGMLTVPEALAHRLIEGLRAAGIDP